MTLRFWGYVPVIIALAACAEHSQHSSLSQSDQASERWDASEDQISQPVIPVTTAAAVLTPELFEDASFDPGGVGSSSPAFAEVVESLPATPSYAIASRTVPEFAADTVGIGTLDTSALTASPMALPGSGVPSAASPMAMAYLDQLVQEGQAPEGSYGYLLIDARDGTVLSERNADLAMAPASIAKLLAAVSILDTKGSSGTFRTTLQADGAISGGVLQGDLHLVGSGDPSLMRADLAAMGRQLAAAGVRQVSGAFYYHGDALPEVPMIDGNQPRGAVYNPGLSGLNIDHNEARGSAPISDPARYAAEAMRRAAGSAGVALPSPQRASGTPSGTEIAAHESAPVESILTEMFDISRNMTAEALGASAAADLSHKPASLREAAAINAAHVQSRIGSIGGSEWSGFDFANNSGLSSTSRATPRQIAALVHYGYQQHGDAFKRIYEQQSAGASAGVNFDIRAKIGTMRFVRGLGGIITLGGREMIFAIMANEPSRYGVAKAWMGKARRLEQALMSDWLQNAWPQPQQTASLR